MRYGSLESSPWGFVPRLSPLVFVLLILSWSGGNPAWGQAPAGEIVLDAGQRLGPSRVSAFYAIQGAPLEASDEQGSNEESREWERRMWRHLGLAIEGHELLTDLDGPGIHVLRNPPVVEPHFLGPLGPGRDLYLDTTVFDSVLEWWAETFGTPIGSFGIFQTPRVLSSNPEAPNFGAFPPADLQEWRAVLAEAVRHVIQVTGQPPLIALFGEIESDVFKALCPGGEPCKNGSEPEMRAFLDLYVVSHYAVKDAHPEARITGPCPSVYSAELVRPHDPEFFGHEDWYRLLREYNASPRLGPPVVPDVACWQGYSWNDEPRLEPMVRHVQKILADNGFDPDTPQVLAGWNRGWISNPRADRGEEFPLHLFPPMLVSNVIEQTNPGGEPGPVQPAFYYTWVWAEMHPSGVVANNALVRTIHDDIFFCFTFSCELPDIAASDKDCLRPVYYAFDALRRMRDGDFIAASRSGSAVDVMATLAESGARAILSNYTAAAEELTVTFVNLPPEFANGEVRIGRVPRGEVCREAGKADPDPNLPLERVSVSRGEDGSLSLVVSMPAESVALLEVVPEEPPSPPPVSPIVDPQYPDFRFWVRITQPSGVEFLGLREPACIPEAVCVSGALPGRAEVFLRIIGPRPNGHLWPVLVKFTPSLVEVWIQQVSSGVIRYYRLEGARPGVDELPGLFDRWGFLP